MVREMPVERFNFFLDEMIKRRNRTLVKDLRKRGKGPHNIPREVLLGDFDIDELDLSMEDRSTLFSEGMVSIGEQLPGPFNYDGMPTLVED